MNNKTPEHIAGSLWAEEQLLPQYISMPDAVLEAKAGYYIKEQTNPARAGRQSEEIGRLLGHMMFEIAMRKTDNQISPIATPEPAKIAA